MKIKRTKCKFLRKNSYVELKNNLKNIILLLKRRKFIHKNNTCYLIFVVHFDHLLYFG